MTDRGFMKLLSALLVLTALCCAALLYLAEYCPEYVPEPLYPASQQLRRWADGLERRIHPEPEPSPDALSYEVVHVIDGDTILISILGVETTVRLIGIDAPESAHRDTEKNTAEGKQAALFLNQFVTGKRVTLEYDEEAKDRYGRTLAYVYADGMMLEDVMLTMGMARTLTMEPNTRYQHHFEMLEKEAREGGTGFWGSGFFER